MKEVKCIGCKRKPEEISEYVYIAKAYGITPLEFVKRFEGTFDKFKPNKFYCTDCYIRAGMPVYRR